MGKMGVRMKKIAKWISARMLRALNIEWNLNSTLKKIPQSQTFCFFDISLKPKLHWRTVVLIQKNQMKIPFHFSHSRESWSFVKIGSISSSTTFWRNNHICKKETQVRKICFVIQYFFLVGKPIYILREIWIFNVE